MSRLSRAWGWLVRAPVPAVAVLAAVATGIAALVVGRIHHFFWTHAGQIGGDDGYTMAMGVRLLKGHFLPYVDGCSHRGPLLYWAAAVAQWATGVYGWTGSRLLSVMTTYGSLFGIFGLGVVSRRPMAGAVGSVFFAWSALTVLAPSPSYVITGEGVAAPICVLALLFVTLALRRAETPRVRLRALFATGVTCALAGLAKQTALPILVPIAFWVFCDLWTRSNVSQKERRAGLAALFGGFSTIALGIVALYGLRGQLGTFWYWYYTYNAEIYMTPYRGVDRVTAIAHFVLFDQPWATGCFAFCCIPWVACALRVPEKGLLRSYAEAGLECTTAALALALFAAALSPLRFWGHYFLCVVPFASFLVGMSAERVLAGEENRISASSAAVCLAACVGFLAVVTDQRMAALRDEARRGVWPTERHEAVCRTIDRVSKPGDPIFVWGFAGELYMTCRRPPASRFTYLTLVAGTVPPDWSNVREDRVARGAREGLIADLEQSKPPVILDAPDTMGHVSMTQIPKVAPFLRGGYCSHGTEQTKHGGKVTVWVRKDLLACDGGRGPETP